MRIQLLIILFLSTCVYAFGQSTQIEGSVKNTLGEPLIGVTVGIENSSTVTKTNKDGFYTIRAQKNANLSFSSVGYQSITVAISNRKTIDIILQEDTRKIDEVVVNVGYGTMKKSDLTGAVSSISSESIQQSVPTTIDQVFQGRIAGLQMSSNSGLPGGGSSIQIRGINSINSTNEPIYVVDGVIMSGQTGNNDVNALAGINPNDIESIEVLKDASASAIYGAQGANGVIIITMKKGKNARPIINFNTKYGLEELPKKIQMMNLREYAVHHNAFSDVLGYGHRTDFAHPEYLGEGTNWQDELYRVGNLQTYDIAVRGGNTISNYAVSAGYLNQDGMIYGSGFKRFTFRLNQETELRPWLKMGAVLNGNYTKQATAVSSWSVVGSSLLQTPSIPVRNADGTFGGPSSEYDANNLGFSNPLAIAQLNQRNRTQFGGRGNFYLEFKPTTWMNFRSELTGEGNTNNYQQFLPAYAFGASIKSNAETRHEKSFNTFWSLKNLFNFNKDFGKKHKTTLMLGHEVIATRYEFLMGERQYGSSELPGLDAGDAEYDSNAGNSNETKRVSFLARGTYNYDDRYLFTATFRRDGSHNFARGHRWGNFPSAALAWRVSQERFFSPLKNTIDDLKFRVSYGAVGNANVDAFAYQAILANTLTNNWGVGYSTSNIPNENITWETTRSWNVGFDLSFLKRRVELVFDAYNKITDDLLLRLSLPSFTGTRGNTPGSAAPPYYNIGAIQNKGIEFSLNTHNIKKPDFNWRSGLVFTLNRNKVTRMNTTTATIQQIDYSNGTNIITQTMQGQPISQFYGYKQVGRINTAGDYLKDNGDGTSTVITATFKNRIGDIVNNEGLATSTYVGDILYADLNQDGIINDADMTLIGSPLPKFTFGFNNTFNYKNFDLTVFLNGSFGHKIFNILRTSLDNPRTYSNVRKDVANYAKIGYHDDNAENTNVWNAYVLPGSDPELGRISVRDAQNSIFSDRFVEDGTFLRVQNIALGYRFPTKFLSRYNINNIRVYSNLQNVFIFTKYKGYTPEVGSSSGQSMLRYGVDGGFVPSPRTYTLGLDITF